MSKEGKMFRGELYVNKGITKSFEPSVQADIDYFLENQPKPVVKEEPKKKGKED